jgi:hypothetical protein
VGLWNELEQQSKLKNENRLVLDGYSFTFSLSHENQNSEGFIIYSPEYETHPDSIRLLQLIQSLSKEL